MATSSTTKGPSTNSGQAATMAELMAKQSVTPVTFQKGDTVTGTVTRFNKKEILVDLSAKGEALVVEKDPRLMQALKHYVKEGDKVEATIITAESESGQAIVSLRKFVDNLMWKEVEKLKKSQELVEVTVNESTRGGLVVSSDTGMSGFIPNSHTVGQNLTIGSKVKVSVADYNRDDRKVIFSQKSTLPLEEFEKAAKQLKKGEKVKATIVNGTNFGYFVTVSVNGQELEGLIHISELAWEKVEDIAGLYQVGDEVEAVILGVDKDSRRVDLSVKRLTQDPFEKIKEQYPLDTKVTGRVTKIEDGNVYLTLDDGVEALMKKEKVPANTTYTTDQTVSATVTSHDSRRRRLEVVPVLLEKPLMYR